MDDMEGGGQLMHSSSAHSVGRNNSTSAIRQGQDGKPPRINGSVASMLIQDRLALGHPGSAGEIAEERDNEDLAADIGAELNYLNISQGSVAGAGTRHD